MKKLSILFVLFFLSTNIFGQSEKLNQLFDQYQDVEGVTSIKIAKPMFRLLGSLKINDEDLNRIQPLLGKVNGLKMLVLEKPRSSMNPDKADQKILDQTTRIQNEINTSLKALKYEELITVNSKDNKIKFISQEASNGVLDNLILNIVSEDASVLMMLDGKISMDDVSKMIEETKNVTALSPISSINSTNTNVSSVRKLSNFDGIELSSGVLVKYTQANDYSVVVNVDPEKQQHIITEVENGILKIFIRNNGVRNLNIRNLSVTVSSPKMNKIVTKSGAIFEATNTITDRALAIETSSGSRVEGDFKISSASALQLSSGSTVKMNLQTSNLALDISSGSFIKLTGNADTVAYSVSSGASCDAVNFSTKRATVSASSGSNVKLAVSDALTASASSASSIQYKGNPTSIVTDAKKITGASITQIN
ncbi:GIN domain-containing protein [Chryseobacterium sp. T1]